MKKFNRSSGGRSVGQFNRESSGRRSPGGFDRRGSGRFGKEGSERRSFGRGSSDKRESGRFERDSESRSPGRFGRSSRPERLKMYEVICDQCRQKCEVPFKPTSDKPVYCSDCFKSKESSGRSSKSPQLEQISEKLDRIMRALHIE